MDVSQVLWYMHGGALTWKLFTAAQHGSSRDSHLNFILLQCTQDYSAKPTIEEQLCEIDNGISRSLVTNTIESRTIYRITRGWFPKFATGLNIIIGCSPKSVEVIKLSFFKNDSSKRGSFWEKDSLITFILLELQSKMLFSIVANFRNHPLCITKMFLGQNQFINDCSYSIDAGYS